MAYIEWSEEYEIGHTIIDKQHRTLVDMLNELHDATENGLDRNVLSNILYGLVEYTNGHFAAEEVRMVKYDYPDYEQHKEEHNGFAEKIHQFQMKYEAEQSDFSQELLEFLKEWLVNHIQGSDRKYAELFIENEK